MAGKIFFSFTISFLLFGFAISTAQVVQTAKEIANASSGDDANILYRHEASTGLIIHSNGWGIDYRRGKHVTGYKKRITEFEWVTMKHPKETTTRNSNFENSKGFVYGKLNSVSVLRTGVGLQKVLYDEENKNSVQVRYGLYGGGSFALAKPIYLEIIYPAPLTGEYQLKTEKYDYTKHNLTNIYGKSSFLKGIDQTKIYPGVYGKVNMSFEYSQDQEVLRILETGIVVDFYPNPVPIMAYNNKNFLFYSFYVSLFFGRKWY